MKLDNWFAPAWRAGCALVILVGLGGVVFAFAQDAPEFRITNDLTYRTINGVELKLDVMEPAQGEGPFPVVICIHGGAWRGGKRQDMKPFMERFVRRGYVAVSPSYRLCPDHVFPAQVFDLKAVVRWIKTNAPTYKIDPERVGAFGVSAGAHLAMMLGTAGPENGLEIEPEEELPANAPSTKIHAVVNVVGPTDLRAKNIPPVSRPLLRDFLGGEPDELTIPAALASPVALLTKDDAPILTFQGTRDPLVPYDQAVLLADKMHEVGVAGRVELLVGEGHGWGEPELSRTLEQSLAFFDRYLKPSRRK
jgi:acetyl esterase/lipase